MVQQFLTVFFRGRGSLGGQWVNGSQKPVN